MAAANDSREPTGAMISKSFLVMVWGFVCKDTPFSRHTGDAVVFFAFLRSLWAFFAVSLKRLLTLLPAKVGFGPAEPNKKTSFSFVSALTFHYLCTHENRKCGVRALSRVSGPDGRCDGHRFPSLMQAFRRGDGIFRVCGGRCLVRMVNRSLEKLAVCDDERPVAIQIYGKEPGPVADAARIVVERARPDMLDLNFGCPVKRVAGKGAGAGMLQNIPKMLEITRAVVDAVDIPVTVKTRLGWDESSKVIVDWPNVFKIAASGVDHTRPYSGADVHRRSGLDAHRRGEKQSAHDDSHHRKRRHHFTRTCP